MINKNNISVKLVGLLLLAIVFHGAAQTDNYSPVKVSFVPPSPNASSLGMYGEVPVSYYTGTPAIDIPIVEAKGRQLSVPVSLSYHASGIKVDQQSGSVGLGWALNAGGVITRTIVGFPDEWSWGYTEMHDLVEGYGTTNTPQENTLIENGSARGQFDLEPDVYYYNFMGRSGKIVFQDGEPFLTPHQNLSITGNVTNGYVITVEDGTRFYFDVIESSSIDPAGPESAGINGNTAWYLSKIISTSGEEVNISYINGTDSYSLGVSEHRRFLKTAQCLPIGWVDPTQICGPTQSSISYSGYTTSTKLISEINSSLSKISFHYASQSNVQSLTEIKIFDYQDLVNPKKRFELTYGTFGDRRPKLISITEKSGLTAIPPHVFAYDATPLPPINSAQQDHWGYYNGNGANTLITTQIVPSYVPGQPVFGETVWEGADRSADSSYGKAGILTEVQYPTGGKTVFEYEGHEYGFVADTEVNLQEIESSQTLVPFDVSTLGVSTSPPIVVDIGQVVDLSIDVDLSQQYEDGENIGGVSVIGSNYNYWFSTTASVAGIVQKKLILNPGTYNIRVQLEDPGTIISVVLRYYKPTGQILSKIPAGGMRIKKVSAYENLTAQVPSLSKWYEYVDNNQSAGVLGAEPRYGNYHASRKVEFDTGTTGTGNCFCDHYYIVSSNQASLGLTQGSHIGYKKVTEIIGGWSNGKTEYYYTSAYDYPDLIVLQPPVNTSYDYKRGLLTKKILYGGDADSCDDECFKLQETVNEYAFDANSIRKVSAMKYLYSDLQEESNTSTANSFFEGLYRHISQWVYLKRTTEISYEAYNTTGSSVVTDYVYANANHLQPTQVTSTGSDGKTQSVSLKYAADLNNTNLLNRKMENQVLEATTSLNGSTIKKIQNNYQLKGANVVPTSHVEFPTGTSDQVKVTYDYDNFGNVIEIRDQQGIITSLIYGHNNSLVIARAIGIPYSQMLSAYNTFVGTGNFETDLRNALPEAQITTYEHDPIYGVIAQTDPAGQRTSFEYDNFGRLALVRDQNNNIIKKYEYHYQQGQ